MAVIQIYLPSREGASKALDLAQVRGKKNEGKGNRDPITEAFAALTLVDRAEATLNIALEEGYEIKAQYPAMHAAGLTLVLYKEDPK